MSYCYPSSLSTASTVTIIISMLVLMLLEQTNSRVKAQVTTTSTFPHNTNQQQILLQALETSARIITPSTAAKEILSKDSINSISSTISVSSVSDGVDDQNLHSKTTFQHEHNNSTYSSKSYKKRSLRAAPEDPVSSDDTINEIQWKNILALGPYLNYTFYLSNSTTMSVTSPNCTMEYPCSTIPELMTAINGRVFSAANNYFLIMNSGPKFIVINVVLLNDMEVECNIKNSIIGGQLMNLMYMFRFTSLNPQERRTLACTQKYSLFQANRFDIVYVLFTYINLRSMIIWNEYRANVGMHKSNLWNVDVINSDTKYNKNVLVEFCTLEYFGLAHFSSVDIIIMYSELKTLNMLKVDTITNLQLLELDISGVVKADFNKIQHLQLRQSRFSDHSTMFFVTNTQVFDIFNSFIEDQNAVSVLFTASKGNAFQFINNVVKRNMIVLDIKAFDTVAIINSTFSDNRIMEDQSKKYDLFFNHNSMVNVKTAGALFIVNSTFDDNYGMKGSHAYLQDIIQIGVSNSRFLNGEGSALVIDTYPVSDIHRFIIQMDNSLFENNISNDYGGALKILYSIHLILINCIFRNNVATFAGGAVHVSLATYIALNGTVFERNRVLYNDISPDEELFHRGAGGALAIDVISINEFPLKFGGATFIENEATVGGAIFYRASGIKEISDSVFRKNKARNTGGAIFHFAPSNMEVTDMVNVQFDQNIAQVFGNDYFTSVNSFSFLEFTTLEFYPGQTIYIPMLTSAGNVSVPCNVDNYVVESPQHPNLYYHVQELADGLNITLLLLNGSLSEYNGITLNATIRVYQSYEEHVFAFVKVLTCPERHEIKFTNLLDTPAYACVFNPAMTWKELLIIVIPAGVAFFVMGSVTTMILLYLCLNICRRLNKLSTKEKAEKAVALKIIDKKIVFGSDHEPSKSNSFYYDTLSYPLLASNEVEMALSRRANAFLIPIEALEIVSKIAEGGQGVVYKALLYGKTDVAVKSLKKLLSDGNGTSDTDEEFEKEVAVLASLKHQNILKFYGISVTDDSKYMVTEYLKNGSLDRMIYRCRTGKALLNLKQKLFILQDISSGLEYLHSLDPPIVHRDLKPGNVLFDSDFKCKICDFGLSRAVGNLNSANTMTKNIGTFLYSSPESWAGSSETVNTNHHDKIMRATRTDVFSFGVMMYELFFEVSPYSYSSKVGGSDESVPVINILAHIVKGNRPVIPFNTVDQVREWLQLYPQKPYETNLHLCQLVLDFFKLVTQCWDQKPEVRPSVKEVSDELKRLTFELSAHCE